MLELIKGVRVVETRNSIGIHWGIAPDICFLLLFENVLSFSESIWCAVITGGN